MTDGRNLSTGAAAAMLDVTQNTLLRWMRAGIVTPASTTAGGHHRWNINDLRRQVTEHIAATTGEPVTEPPSDKPQRPAVITAIVTSARGVLIGRRNDGKPPWTFIAGENEPGESPADTIVREVKEETGLRIAAGRIIGERVHPKSGRHMVYVAAAPVGDSLSVFVGDEEELGEVRWATLAEAGELLPGMFEPVREHLEKALSE
jgi:8-oxo-dGTP diphosphatase